MTLTMTDLFCGAGGSSTGAVGVPGVEVAMAANHWALAIETHNTNHPEARHDCADISQVDPRRYPRTDILWASPECTNHSVARGKKRALDCQPDLFGEVLPDAAAERSRATMWDVVRFAEHHRYRAVIVENVVDAYHWEPFQAWLSAMDSLGYEHQVVWLNSMHAQAGGLPAPQSRDRMYVVFHRRGGRRPEVSRFLRPRAWCVLCDRVVDAVQAFKRTDRPAWGRYRAQYVYRCPAVKCRNSIVEPGWLPAAAAIDWTIPGERIGDRAKPLADKTRARIAAGLLRYARPFTAEVAGNTFERRPGVRTWPVDDVLRTLHTTQSKALLVPVEGREAKSAAPAAQPLRTQTARNETALLVPAGGTWNEDARPVEEVMRTRTTRDTEALVVAPFLTINREGQRNRPVDEAMPTVVASPNPMGVVVPPFIAELRGGGSDHRSVDQPLATVTASGNHHGLVVPLRTNGTATQVTDPLRTCTAGTVGMSLIQWAALYSYDTGRLRGMDKPLPTQTTVEGDALLTGDLPEVDDCLFRMLEPHEIARGMAFPDDYVMLGNKRERVRLAGNAVTPPAARDLIAAVAESLLGDGAAA